MLPRIHILIGLIISTILFFIFPEINLIEATIIFLSSFLIDFDHYLYYVFKFKEFKVGEIYRIIRKKGKEFKELSIKERKKYSTGFFCFHGIESIIIALVLGYSIHHYFYFVGVGIFIHLIFDWIYLKYKKQRFFKLSIIYDYIKNKTLKLI